MGFFAQLFGRKKCKFSPEALDISITEDTLIINGSRLEIPCHLDMLKSQFGKPRKFDNRQANVIFTWDEIGIYCYTKGNNVVFCLGIKTKPNTEVPFEYDPKSMFKGRLCINGESWERFISAGEDEEVGRCKRTDNLTFFADYADIEKGDADGCENAYSGIEIQLKDR